MGCSGQNIVPVLAVPQSERRHIRDAAAGKIDVVRVTVAPHNTCILTVYCSDALASLQDAMSASL
jgi:hypothetical protein